MHECINRLRCAFVHSLDYTSEMCISEGNEATYICFFQSTVCSVVIHTVHCMCAHVYIL